MRAKYPGYVSVETREYGLLHLRPSLRVKDLMSLTELAASDTDAREFAVQAVVCVLDSPKLTAPEIRSWDDGLLSHVIDVWAEKKRGAEWYLPEEMPTFEAFRTGFSRYLMSVSRSLVCILQRLSTVDCELSTSSTLPPPAAFSSVHAAAQPA